jgi:hypothetical protein
MRPKRERDSVYESSAFDPESIRRYARKVAQQAQRTALPYFPGSPNDPIWLLSAAPAEATRSIILLGNEQFTTLDQEGVLIGLRPDGTLVSGNYSYGTSWAAGESERFDEHKIEPLNHTMFSFRPLPDYMLTYLDVGRDRWHEVRVPNYGSTVKREELNQQRYPIVHAKGVGMSRALKELFTKAGGSASPGRPR